MLAALCRTFPRRSFQVFGPYFTSSRSQYPWAYVSNNSSSEKSPWNWRVPLVLGVGSFIGVGAWVFEGDNPQKRIRLLQIIPLRMARNVSTASMMVTDYLMSLQGLPEGSIEKDIATHEVHIRNAHRLKELCFANGGIYIKFGQHIGQLDYLVPKEFVQVMRASMLDKCPVQTYKQVCDVFLAELGQLPHEIYMEFTEAPLASASLAQVHAARTFDGRQVAVKVQHTHLTDTADADMATVHFVVHVGHWLIPAFDYRWLVDEMRESLPNEMDFMLEGKNAELCKANFAKMSPHLASKIAVPKIYWELSTSRLMAMEFMKGVGVTDVAAMERLGIQPSEVARLISQTFAEMIFHHGFVHCDPHAANMMLRLKPGTTNEPQLILLDHGLYKTLDPQLRANYAGLWRSLVFADVKGIKEHSLKMGAGEDLYTLFASVLTMRPWCKVIAKSIDHLQFSTTKEDVNEIQGAPANTFVILGRASSEAYSELSRRGALSSLWKAMDKAEVEIRLWTWQVAAVMVSHKTEILKVGIIVVPTFLLLILSRP